MYYNSDIEAPFPDNLEDALTEIGNLRRILFREREMLAKVVLQRELDNRSAAGQLAALRAEVERLKKEAAE